MGTNNRRNPNWLWLHGNGEKNRRKERQTIDWACGRLEDVHRVLEENGTSEEILADVREIVETLDLLLAFICESIPLKTVCHTLQNYVQQLEQVFVFFNEGRDTKAKARLAMLKANIARYYFDIGQVGFLEAIPGGALLT